MIIFKFANLRLLNEEEWAVAREQSPSSEKGLALNNLTRPLRADSVAYMLSSDWEAGSYAIKRPNDRGTVKWL
jgi:hypothetical protein